ncbi:MAG TPA: hypothetical protein VFX49_10890, partial [Chloroflexota bacterium]|nr:hypothetical protein [Chloroflexota bacterium]
MSGLWASLAGFFTQGVGGYATLLVFSLATITGSMYVISAREAGLALNASVLYEGSELGTGNQADFKPEISVRTLIVQFEGGVAVGVREAVTNLAGAIRAVSSNIIAEAQREDALRAAALAARQSAFGLSADAQLAAGALVITQPPPAPPPAPPAPSATAVVV